MPHKVLYSALREAYERGREGGDWLWRYGERPSDILHHCFFSSDCSLSLNYYDPLSPSTVKALSLLKCSHFISCQHLQIMEEWLISYSMVDFRQEPGILPKNSCQTFMLMKVWDSFNVS
jgi:hypothetical protein